MKTRIFAVALGVAIGLASGSTIANVNEKMAEMFGTQSNFTRPGTVEGATRGVITGGNVSIRTPIVSPSGFSFDPPSASAGCGGIDMYGGNLSFPSKEQYIATARAVVGNVGGYAFRSALKFTCEACESVMSAIQETVNMMNMDNMNSCQIAKGIYDGDIAGQIETNRRNVAAKWEEARGDVVDFFESFNSGKGKDSPTKAAAEDTEMAGVMQGNWTWESMDKTRAFDWLGDDKRTREEIMTLVGTVITCVPGVNGCEGEGTDTVYKTLEPRLRLHDFVAPDAQASKEYQIYSCKNEPCLSVNVTASRPLGGSATQKIMDALLGKEGEPGILDKMVMDGRSVGKLSAQEKAIIANTNVMTSVAVACMNAGPQGQGYAKLMVEGLAPVITADALYRASTQSLQAMISDLSARTGVAGAPETVELLKKAEVSLREQYNDIRNNSTTNDMLGMAVDRCGRSPVATAGAGVFR